MDKKAERKQQEERVGRYLKGVLKQAGVTYEELAVKLLDFGFKESKASIASKLGRGSFSATFMIAVLRAIGKDSVNVVDV
jgi:Domain of unknown function (DUF6471)